MLCVFAAELAELIQRHTTEDRDVTWIERQRAERPTEFAPPSLYAGTAKTTAMKTTTMKTTAVITTAMKTTAMRPKKMCDLQQSIGDGLSAIRAEMQGW